VWIWLIAIDAFFALVLLIFGYRRLNVPRRVSPEEGIEDIEVVQAYDRISKWPQFKLLRMMIIGELKKYNPNGVLVDVGCGHSKVIPKPICHWGGHFRGDGAKSNEEYFKIRSR